jgi:cystathionine beta-lyase/cystathionine gamma-synthase
LPTMHAKLQEAATIAQQVAEFLARGGKIDQVDHTANRSFSEPIVRKKADQVKWVKRMHKKG